MNQRSFESRLNEDALVPNILRRESAEWNAIVFDTLGPDAALIGVSRWIPHSRVYRNKTLVAKIRRILPSCVPGAGSLARESELLASLSRTNSYYRGDRWETLILPRILGTPITDHHYDRGTVDFSVIAGAARELARLNRRGVSYRDLRFSNILKTDAGQVQLVDFDQSRASSPVASFVQDWLGAGPAGISPNPFWKFALLARFPKAEAIARRARGMLAPRKVLTQLGFESESWSIEMEAAWKVAQISSANSPGQNLAYYSLSIGNSHFRGERPWYLRWEPVERRVDFRGKKIVELGCNMGLFSSFALVHGAREAVGVDSDPIVIQSARMMAEAIGVGARFHVADLVNDRDWERRIGVGDVAVAMSLLHWLPNAARVQNFLSLHNELVYEGHACLADETTLLRELGFTNISILGVTERGRELLLASR